MPSLDFEPLVEFPDNPYNAARMYFALMAYPKLGACVPGGLGARFVEALWQYTVWDERRRVGLKALRDRSGLQADQIPRKRDFEGAINRGVNRVERRIAAFDIIANQMINGIFNSHLRVNAMARAGRADQALSRPVGSEGFNPIRSEILAEATPSPRRIVRNNLNRWSERMGLNRTGPSADPAQKEKDVIRRGYRESMPVMHLAHGLNIVMDEIAPNLNGWDQVDPVLLLLWHSEEWVWEALQRAEAFRFLASVPGSGLPPRESMIELTLPEKCAG